MLLVILLVQMSMQHLRVPGVIGLIIAGATIDPNAFHIVERGQAIQLLGTVGLLYILMSAGLERDLHRFRKYRSHSVMFAVTPPNTP